MKKEGYVVFVNNNEKYISLLNILIESVLNFSTRPIEVFGINFDYIHSSNRVITRRINVDRVGFDTICYSKLYSSFNSEFDYGIQIDSDFIITKEMDFLFKESHKWGEYPLGSLHPQDPNNQKPIMDYLGVSIKSQPYVHATYLFSKESKLFLEECYNVSQELLSKGIVPANYDETILNTMLWKYNNNKWVDTYDIFYEDFVKNNKNFHGYPSNFNLNYYSCHGCKDVLYAKKILEDLIKLESK